MCVCVHVCMYVYMKKFGTCLILLSDMHIYMHYLYVNIYVHNQKTKIYTCSEFDFISNRAS